MLSDCEKYAMKCDACQRHGPMKLVPTEDYSSAMIAYPFMRWTMDAVGLLKQSHGKKNILIMTYYFTKWVEAEAYGEIT